MYPSKLISSLLIFIAFTATSCTQAVGDKNVSPEGWLTNYEQALSEAREQKKPVLIEFTGSDWCPPCMRLAKEVLSTGTFMDYARDSLVLLHVDFPRKKKLSEEQVAHNEKLAQQFAIQYVPALFLVDGNGKLIKQIEYRGGGPEAFITTIKNALK